MVFIDGGPHLDSGRYMSKDISSCKISAIDHLDPAKTDKSTRYNLDIPDQEEKIYERGN
jgi:hypothetical protein